MTRLVVVGLGLIGGSLALRARERGLFDVVVGVDGPELTGSPLAARAADAVVDGTDAAARARALDGATLAVLATPVSAIVEALPEALSRAQVVTDCGSTKRAVCRAAQTQPEPGRFVPGHPMAGAPEGGLAFARADLFEGARWFLCPEGVEPGALARVEELVAGLGATPVAMSAEQHDRAVALVSHVPQLLASVMQVLSVRRGAAGAAGPAFARLTRGAGGQEAMWRDVFATNGDEIARAVGALTGELEALRGELSREPAPELERALALLAEARRARGG